MLTIADFMFVQWPVVFLSCPSTSSRNRESGRTEWHQAWKDTLKRSEKNSITLLVATKNIFQCGYAMLLETHVKAQV